MSRKRWFGLQTRQAIWGYLFTAPFLIGFVLFVLNPFVQSLRYSFHELEMASGGYSLTFVGWGNYSDALFVHGSYVRVLTETIVTMLSDVPLILIFSFFAATLLNQEFKGRLLARLIFFLPVIMASGVILQMESGDYMMGVLQPGSGEQTVGGGLLSSGAVRTLLWQLMLPEGLLEYIISAVDRIPDVIKASGIQILVFLAGLQSIPSSLYEASNMEGAGAWENFWKITFPLMSPLILTNIVYTVVASFTAPNNRLVGLIRDTAFRGMGFGVSAAMAWVYFVAIAVILLVSIGVVSRWVFYQE